uniref:Uncharacterized protein n=1 Tax=Cannabis sativa TaxID=3483 RepID=A0A803Q5K9_CANSA
MARSVVRFWGSSPAWILGLIGLSLRVRWSRPDSCLQVWDRFWDLGPGSVQSPSSVVLCMGSLHPCSVVLFRFTSGPEVRKNYFDSARLVFEKKTIKPYFLEEVSDWLLEKIYSPREEALTLQRPKELKVFQEVVIHKVDYKGSCEYFL